MTEGPLTEEVEEEASEEIGHGGKGIDLSANYVAELVIPFVSAFIGSTRTTKISSCKTSTMVLLHPILASTSKLITVNLQSNQLSTQATATRALLKLYLLPIPVLTRGGNPDSGASHHIIFDKINLMNNPEYAGSEQVFGGNGKAISIANIGRLQPKVATNKCCTIGDSCINLQAKNDNNKCSTVGDSYVNLHSNFVHPNPSPTNLVAPFDIVTQNRFLALLTSATVDTTTNIGISSNINYFYTSPPAIPRTPKTSSILPNVSVPKTNLTVVIRPNIQPSSAATPVVAHQLLPSQPGRTTPTPQNRHPIQTRRKSGIFKPKAFTVEVNLGFSFICSYRWILRVKKNSDDTVQKVASVQVMPSVAFTKSWKIHQFDFNNAFFNGDLHETVYMQQSEDDILVIGDSENEIKELMTQLHSTFSLKELGEMHYFISIEVVKIPNRSITLKQTKYIKDLLKIVKMSNAKLVPTQ
nr:uncharacterized protein LOC112757913 [Arachis hypogaea]XP_025704089.1 uncharacterized protein LOC112805989 [Arachis hypogaea]